MKEQVERAGLKLGNLMLPRLPRRHPQPWGADDDIEKVQESIRVAGRVGARLAAHDYGRSRNLPVLDDVGRHSAADLWTRYERFLKAVVPIAERAGVRLAVHPNDPPPPSYRGTEQILGSVDGLRRVCEVVRSPANGITLDTGVTREMGSNVIDTIKWFGARDQINHVDFRQAALKGCAASNSRANVAGCAQVATPGETPGRENQGWCPQGLGPAVIAAAAGTEVPAYVHWARRHARTAGSWAPGRVARSKATNTTWPRPAPVGSQSRC